MRWVKDGSEKRSLFTKVLVLFRRAASIRLLRYEMVLNLSTCGNYAAYRLARDLLTMILEGYGVETIAAPSAGEV